MPLLSHLSKNSLYFLWGCIFMETGSMCSFTSYLILCLSSVTEGMAGEGRGCGDKVGRSLLLQGQAVLFALGLWGNSTGSKPPFFFLIEKISHVICKGYSVCYPYIMLYIYNIYTFTCYNMVAHVICHIIYLQYSIILCSIYCTVTLF